MQILREFKEGKIKPEMKPQNVIGNESNCSVNKMLSATPLQKSVFPRSDQTATNPKPEATIILPRP